MPPFKSKHLSVVTLWAEDVPTTVHFYRDVLGLDLLPGHGHMPAFDLGGGAHLVIAKGQPCPPRHAERPHFPAIAFAVHDLDQAIEHLESCGVELPWGIQAGQDTRWAVFRDPAGNLVELAQL